MKSKSGVGIMLIEKLKSKMAKKDHDSEGEDAGYDAEAAEANEEGYDEDMGEGDDNQVLAEEMIAAIESGDSSAFAEALESFVQVCTDDYEGE